MRNYQNSGLSAFQISLKSIFLTFILTTISLVGFGQLPSSWVVSPSSFAYDGEVNAKVVIDNVDITSGGFLAAFVGEECRGVAEGYNNPLGAHIFTMRIYSNSSSGEVISFKFFDTNSQQIIDIDQTIYFAADMIIGSAFTPEIFTGQASNEPNIDATLINLLVDGITVTGFDPATLSYMLELPYGTITIPTVTVTANDENASIVITVASQLPGATSIEVTAEDGTTVLTYRVNFTLGNDLGGIENWKVTPSNYAYDGEVNAKIVIDNVDITSGGLLGAFVDEECRGVAEGYNNPLGAYIFTMRIYSNSSSGEVISFKFFDANSQQIIDLDQNLEFAADMIVGSAFTPEIFTGQTGGETSNDASLSDLLVEGASLINFDSDTLSYTIELPYGTSTVPVVTATANDENAIIYIYPAQQLPGVTSISVIAEDGTTTLTYMVAFTIAAPNNDATLIDLLMDGNTLPDFNSETLTYSVELPYGTTTVPVITATSNDSKANVNITDALQLPGASTIVVIAEDGITTIIYTVNFTIIPNEDPVLTLVYDQTTPEDTPLQLAVEFTDDPNETHSVTVVSDNESVTVEVLEQKSESYPYTLNPSLNFFGSANITVTVEDERGGSATETFVLTVTPVNDLPLLETILGQTIAEGDEFIPINLNDFISDVETPDALIQWAVTYNPDLKDSQEQNLIVNIDPDKTATILVKNKDWFGEETLRFTATDEDGESVYVDVVFIVTSENDPPVTTQIPNQTIDEGAQFEQINLSDFVTDLETSSENMLWSYSGDVYLTIEFDPSKLHYVSITPKDENWNGSETILFTAEDEGGLTATTELIFTVNPVNDAPVSESIPEQIIEEGGSFNTIDLKEYFEDTETADNDFIWKYSKVSTTKKTADEAISISISADGIVTITINDENWNGQEEYTFTATDEGGLIATSNVMLKVTPINDPPVVIAPMGTKNKAEDFSEFLVDLTQVFYDVDNETLYYKIVSVVPEGIANVELFEDNKLKLSSITDAVGQTLITVSASDVITGDPSVTDILTLNVTNANDAPVLTTPLGTDDKAEDFETFTIDLNTIFTDSDGEDLSFTITETSGSSISGDIVGNLLSVSSVKDAFSDGNTITVEATDGFSESASDVLTVNVAAVNDAPIISGQAVLTTPEDTPFELLITHLTIDDPDNNYPDDFTIIVVGGDNYTVNGQVIIPKANYSGQLTVPVMVKDSELFSTLFDVLLMVESTNDQPVITQIGNQMMDEDGKLEVNLIFNDNDLNDTHILQITSIKPEVTINFNSDINQNNTSFFEIIPDKDWYGTANITVNVTDNSGAANAIGTEVFVLTVKNINDKPVIVTQTIAASTQNQAYSETLNFTDIDSPTLSFTLVSAPSWLEVQTTGSIPVVDKQASIILQGTPDPSARDFLLVVKVSDESLSSTASYELKVTQINYSPVVADATYSVTEDMSKMITLTGSDNETPQADLVFAIPMPPQHGALVLNEGTKNIYTYKPSADYFGTDFFTYSVTDEAGKTSTARIDLNVVFVNDRPVISADKLSYSTAQNTPFIIVLAANDSKDGTNAAPLNYTIASTSVNGLLTTTAAPGSFTYTPNTGFYGNDKVIFRAVETEQNPNLASLDLTRIITVVRENKAPVAYDKTQKVKEDKLIVFNLLASDDKTDILNMEYQIVSPATHALTFIKNKNEINYQAEENYNGTDQFTFKVKDENGVWSNVATVDIDIEAVNDFPIGQNLTAPADGATFVLVDFSQLITDPDTPIDQLGLEFTLESSTGAAGALGGTFTLESGSTYRFDQGITGLPNDVVLYRIKEGDYYSSFYTVEITGMASTKSSKDGANLLAVPTNFNVDYGNSVLVEFMGLDLSSPYEQLTIEVTGNPSHGTLSNFQLVSYSGNTTKYSATYTPTNNSTIQDVITFSVSDGVDTESADITINISSANVAPVLTDIENVQLTEDTPVNINIPFTDADTDPANLTWTFTSTPAVEGLVFNVINSSTSPASIGITLPQDYTGSSTIELKLEDNTSLYDEIDFTLTVDNENDAPELDVVTNQDSLEDEDFMLTVTATDVDTDNTSLSYSAICNPPTAAASISFSDNEMTFSPTANFDGDVDITLKVEDNESPSLSNELTFTLSVENQNDEPELVLIPDPEAIDEDSGVIEISIMATDIDTEDNLEISYSSSNTSLFPEGSVLIDQATAASGVERTLSLTHAENLFGTSVITITASDGLTSTARQFNVTINEVNDKPVLSNIESITMEENSSVQVSLVASDVDSPTLTFSAVSNNTDLTVSIVNNGGSYAMDISSLNNYNGLSQITVSVDDNEGGITLQIVDVTVSSVDQIPYLLNPIEDVYAQEDDADIIIALGNVFDDPDNDNTLIELSIDNVTDNSFFSSSITGADLTFELLENVNGEATVTIKGISNGKTVYDVFNVQVAPVDDPPMVLNPVVDIEAQEDAEDILVSISDVFDDIDNENALIEFSIDNISDATLLSASLSGTDLTIDLAENANGNAIITLKAVSNGEVVYDEFNVNITAVDDAPEILNALSDVEVDMNDADYPIDLSTVFTDIDNEDALIAMAITANTNSALVTTSTDGQSLTLSFANNQFGTADITVEATSNGKTVTDVFRVIVIDNTAIGDLDDSEFEFIIRPNPNDGQFQIQFSTESYERFVITIYDLTGKIIYSEEPINSVGKYEKDFDIRSFGKGIYIFQIQTESNKLLTKKIVVN